MAQQFQKPVPPLVTALVFTTQGRDADSYLSSKLPDSLVMHYLSLQTQRLSDTCGFTGAFIGYPKPEEAPTTIVDRLDSLFTTARKLNSTRGLVDRMLRILANDVGSLNTRTDHLHYIKCIEELIITLRALEGRLAAIATESKYARFYLNDVEKKVAAEGNFVIVPKPANGSAIPYSADQRYALPFVDTDPVQLLCRLYLNQHHSDAIVAACQNLGKLNHPLVWKVVTDKSSRERFLNFVEHLPSIH